MLLEFTSCGNASTNSKIQESKNDTTLESKPKKDSVDYTKEFQFIDTTFEDGSTMKISSHWIKNDNPDLICYFLDSLVLDLKYLETSTRLTYYVSGAASGEPNKIDRLTDKNGNIYCFMQFPTTVTYGSTSLIGYRQNTKGFKKISFNKGEDELFTSYCEFIIDLDKIIMSCSAKPSSGVDEDTDYIYTKKSETSYIKTKTKIKR